MDVTKGHHGISYVKWMGFSAHIQDLIDAGWIIEDKSKHVPWEDVLYAAPQASSFFLLRHPEKRMVGRMRMSSFDPDPTVELLYLSHELSTRGKPIKQFVRELTVDHLPALYAAIIKLQAKYPKPSPTDNVIKFIAGKMDAR